ncbi:transposase [Arcicella gelida]|uniref:transposase n=1 Tax=Arcicella gelida TaxID=2984195 RepID=UPI0038995640
MKFWQKRGLYIFFLPPYSPHLNRAAFRIIERIWKELKARWIKPEDYISFDNLRYATINCLKNIGINLNIKFTNYC